MASYQPPVYNRSLLAAADLSAKQYYFVGENGSNKYNVTGHDTLGALGQGFLMNTPQADEFCEVATVGGGAKAVSAGVIAAKAELIAKADGTVITAPAGSAGDVLSIIGIALEAAVSGDIFSVQPVLYTKTIHA
jgi:hypothetical protein